MWVAGEGLPPLFLEIEMLSYIKVLVKCIGCLVVLSIVFMKAQGIQPMPIPEPVIIHICGDDFHPSDFAFDHQGVLYAIEVQRPNKPLEIYTFSNITCTPVPLDFEPESNVIATDSKGDICVP
jgi:hypothetical protein